MSFDPDLLFLSVVISAVGLGIFIYGKKQRRWPQLAAGLILMGYSYFVSSVPWMLGIAAGILLGLWLLLRLRW